MNAAGPWAGDVLTTTLACEAPAAVRLVKGSHIVVPRLYAHDRCYIFQNSDGRVFFAIPFEANFTLIGTTDQDYTGDPDQVEATADEISYLCSAASEYFKTPVEPGRVKWTYSGVRPLYDDGASDAQAATRDYVLKLDGKAGEAPLVTIFGGKITTYRRLGGIRFGDAGAPFVSGRGARAAGPRRVRCRVGIFRCRNLTHYPNEPGNAIHSWRREQFDDWFARTGRDGERILSDAKSAESRKDLRSRPERSGGSLSRAKRMGELDRGRPVAAQQAGFALFEG